MVQRLFAFAKQVVINAYVKMRIEELLIQPLLRRLAGTGRGEHILGLQLALVEIVDLPHRHAPVVADLEDALRLRDAVLFAMHINRQTAFSTSLLSKSW